MFLFEFRNKGVMLRFVFIVFGIQNRLVFFCVCVCANKYEIFKINLEYLYQKLFEIMEN